MSDRTVTYESDELAAAAGPRPQRKLRRKAKSTRGGRSRQVGIPPTAKAEWARRKNQAGAERVSLGKDARGFYAYKGSRRTASYKTPKKIPLAAIRDVEMSRGK